MIAKLYDPRCAYAAGDLVWHPKLQTLAHVLEMVSQPGQVNDKALLEFIDPAVEAERQELGCSNWFAVNLGRRNIKPETTRIRAQRKPGARGPILRSGKFVFEKPSGEPLPQCRYRSLILALIDKDGQTTAGELKAAVQEILPLTPADWYIYGRKPVWLRRLHGELHHLQRTNIIESPRRGVYRRRQVQEGRKAA